MAEPPTSGGGCVAPTAVVAAYPTAADVRGVRQMAPASRHHGGHDSSRCRRRGRHSCRHRHGHGRRQLRRAGVRRARGRPPPTAASAAAAAALPPAVVAAALSHRAQGLRERTRPPRPPRIQCRHDAPFEISKWTSPTGPPELDSGQLPQNCDIMAVRGHVHLPLRPRKRRTCPHVPF